MTTTAAALADLLAAARAIQPDLVATRRQLHRRAEVGNDLPATQAVVLKELARLGIEGRPGAALSSIVAVIDGGRSGRTVLLRADMDALPVTEETGLDFASETDGVMHACGHDTHVTMLLGAARLLQGRRADLAGRVVLMFQPGEEGLAGAKTMLDEGLLATAAAGGAEPPSGAFAIHVSTRYPSGEVHLRPGPIMAATDTIRITVRGRGGHASTPHLANDPIPVAAEIVLALQTLVARNVNAFDPAVITIGQISGGTTMNIIPETVFLYGTMRTVSLQTRETVRTGIRRLAEGIAAAHGVTAEVDLEEGYPLTLNDEAYAEVVRDIAAELVGADRVRELRAPVMGAEDFSYVLQQVPGAMVFLGACLPELDPATAPQFHSNRVVFHEDVMPIGVALHAGVAIRHLAGSRAVPVRHRRRLASRPTMRP